MQKRTAVYSLLTKISISIITGKINVPLIIAVIFSGVYFIQPPEPTMAIYVVGMWGLAVFAHMIKENDRMRLESSDKNITLVDCKDDDLVEEIKRRNIKINLLCHYYSDKRIPDHHRLKINGVEFELK